MPPSNYPAGTDSFPRPTALDHMDAPGLEHAELHNAIADAVEAIQETVGVNPQGVAPSVASRLLSSDVDLGGVITLPGSPYGGQMLHFMATADTPLPPGVTWDGGGAPEITGRRVLSFLWDGEGWLGTYTPQFPGAGIAGLREQILAFGPAGYWILDETSGTTAFDSSGNGRNGTYTGGYTLAADGVTLNGSTGYVNLADRDQWSINHSGNGITFFALVRPTTTPSTRQAVFAKGNASAYEYAITSIAPYTGQVEGSVNIPAGSPLASDISNAGPLTGGAWHAVAYAVPHPSPSPFSGDLYVDGGPISTYQGSVTTGTYVNNASPARIGSREGGGLFFNGRFRHAAIFPRRLTPAEVQSLIDAATTEGLI